MRPAVRVPFTQDRHRLREGILSAATRQLDLRWTCEAALRPGGGHAAPGARILDGEPLAGLPPARARRSMWDPEGDLEGRRRSARGSLLPRVRFSGDRALRATRWESCWRCRASADLGRARADGTWRSSRPQLLPPRALTRADRLLLRRAGRSATASLALAPGGRTTGACRFTLRSSAPGPAERAGRRRPDAYPAEQRGGHRASPLPGRTRVFRSIGGSERGVRGRCWQPGPVRRGQPSCDSGGRPGTEDAIHVWARGGVEGTASRRAIYLSPLRARPAPIGEAGYGPRTAASWSGRRRTR